jgi:hypothetical protein
MNRKYLLIALLIPSISFGDNCDSKKTSYAISKRDYEQCTKAKKSCDNALSKMFTSADKYFQCVRSNGESAIKLQEKRDKVIIGLLLSFLKSQR